MLSLSHDGLLIILKSFHLVNHYFHFFCANFGFLFFAAPDQQTAGPPVRRHPYFYIFRSAGAGDFSPSRASSVRKKWSSIPPLHRKVMKSATIWVISSPV